MVDTSDPESRSAKGSTVTRVLDILGVIAAADRPLSPTEISENLSIPKASVHRLCASMEEQGYLQTRLSGRGLQAGNRLQALALGVLSAAPLQAQRRAILTSLSEEIGETCNIAVPDGAEMIYFDRAETHWPVRISLKVGSRVPVCATAGGKMYLSTLNEERLERVVRNTRLKRYTANTLVSVSDLMADLEVTGQRGYSLDNEEYLEGMVAMAVPVVDGSGRLYATLSFHAPCMRVPFVSVTRFLPQLKAASKQLSALLDD
ncbi:MAG: IclR family transcriptional regulator [Granulosicoccus sp.]